MKVGVAVGDAMPLLRNNMFARRFQGLPRSWFILLLCFPALTLVADGMVRGGSNPNRAISLAAAEPDRGTWEVGTGLRDRLEVTVNAGSSPARKSRAR